MLRFAFRLDLLRRITLLRWTKRACILCLPLLLYLNWPNTDDIELIFFSTVMSLGLFLALRAWEFSLRRQFVREAALPRFLTAKLIEHYPQLSVSDAELVQRGLRQFFLCYLRGGGKFVAMPSKVVDTAWHEFILFTKGYENWCHAAFGRLLHHSPAEVLGSDSGRNNGLRRVWYWTCKEENINPRRPSRLPLIFALDKKLDIIGGFIYAADCSNIRPYVHCGTELGERKTGFRWRGGSDLDGIDKSGCSGSDGSGCGGGSGGSGGCGGD